MFGSHALGCRTCFTHGFPHNYADVPAPPLSLLACICLLYFLAMTSLLSPPPHPSLLSAAAIPLPLPSAYEDDMMASPPVPSSASLSEPPTYSPSAAVPPYSDMPGPSERTLAVAARSCRRMPLGVFVRSNGLVTVALRGQDEHARAPSYGRHGRICGDISLSCTQGVQSIYITVCATATSYLYISVSPSVTSLMFR